MANDTQAEIERLLKSILEVMKQTDSLWVSWRQVAKKHTGSAESADYLSSYAALPEWKHLFATTQNKVKVTDDGRKFVSEGNHGHESQTSSIADAVVDYARSLKPIFLKIQEISIVANIGNKFVHAIQVDLTDEVLPSETPAQITFENSRTAFGKLVGQEPDGDILYVVCDSDITDDQIPKWLIIDRSYLLTQLADQLRRLESLPERFKALTDKQSRSIIANDDSLQVAKSLASLTAPWTQYLWGPPGAGKTYGLAELMAILVQKHPQESILIVAPSNRAVDVAAIHLKARLDENLLGDVIKKRKVLRFGYPRAAEILELPEMLGPDNLDSLNSQVRHIAKEIASVRRESRKDSELATLRAKLLAAQEAVKAAVTEHVSQCSIVATTTTLAYMPNSPVAAKMWDTVIVDEVTMVPPAVCAFLASRAKQRFLLAGDPCQLGPVFEESGLVKDNTKTWMKSDIFVLGGVSSGKLTPEAIDLTNGKLARISAQRRCAVDIWNRVSHLYPLVANASNHQKLRRITEMRPSSGASLAFVDTAKSGAKCEKMKNSWQNIKSAMMALKLATLVASQTESPYRIAIICPYRAQVKLLRQWLREFQKLPENLFGTCVVEAGTVHQFQGSEADVVIFDLVDGEGRATIGRLLLGDSGTRLVNVAISRAKGKFIVVADREWCRNANIVVTNRLLSNLVFGGTSIRTFRTQEIDESLPVNQRLILSSGANV